MVLGVDPDRLVEGRGLVQRAAQGQGTLGYVAVGLEQRARPVRRLAPPDHRAGLVDQVGVGVGEADRGVLAPRGQQAFLEPRDRIDRQEIVRVQDDRERRDQALDRQVQARQLAEVPLVAQEVALGEAPAAGRQEVHHDGARVVGAAVVDDDQAVRRLALLGQALEALGQKAAVVVVADDDRNRVVRIAGHLRIFP